QSLPRGGTRPQRHGRRLLDRPHTGNQPRVRRLVEATGYVTFAEIPPDPKDYPGASPDLRPAATAAPHAHEDARTAEPGSVGPATCAFPTPRAVCGWGEPFAVG